MAGRGLKAAGLQSAAAVASAQRDGGKAAEKREERGERDKG